MPTVEGRGFSVKADLVSISLVAVCIVAVSVMVLGRKAPQITVAPCQAAAPVIQVVPAAVTLKPRVIVKKVFVVVPDEPNTQPLPQSEKDPFRHRTPIITQALKTSMNPLSN